MFCSKLLNNQKTGWQAEASRPLPQCWHKKQQPYLRTVIVMCKQEDQAVYKGVSSPMKGRWQSPVRSAPLGQSVNT